MRSVMEVILSVGETLLCLFSALLCGYTNATSTVDHPNQGSAEAVAGLDNVRNMPPILRDAVSFIQDNADADIGLEDIAAAVNVSPRSVQYAFRRNLGTTPLEYLRRVRLDRAHRDLKAADPGERHRHRDRRTLGVQPRGPVQPGLQGGVR